MQIVGDFARAAAFADEPDHGELAVGQGFHRRFSRRPAWRECRRKWRTFRRQRSPRGAALREMDGL
jgi:hypothetical protein